MHAHNKTNGQTTVLVCISHSRLGIQLNVATLLYSQSDVTWGSGSYMSNKHNTFMQVQIL